MFFKAFTLVLSFDFIGLWWPLQVWTKLTSWSLGMPIGPHTPSENISTFQSLSTGALGFHMLRSTCFCSTRQTAQLDQALVNQRYLC